MGVEFWMMENGRGVLVATVAERDAPSVRIWLERTAGELVGSRRKEVFVEAVDEETYRKYPEALPLEPGQTFGSALAASVHIGCKGNPVGVALAAAKKSPDPDLIKHAARVRGVTFIFSEDLP